MGFLVEGKGVRCFQCQIGNHDNCSASIFDMGRRFDCCCWECTEDDRFAAKARDEKRRVESWKKITDRMNKTKGGG